MHALAGVTTETCVDMDSVFPDVIVDFSTALAVSMVSGILSLVATAMAMAGMPL